MGYRLTVCGLVTLVSGSLAWYMGHALNVEIVAPLSWYIMTAIPTGITSLIISAAQLAKPLSR